MVVAAVNNTHSSDKIRLLEKILEDIKNGSASLADYQDYERILDEIGGNTNQMRNTLKSHRLYGWQDYINRRKAANTYQKKRETEAVIAGSLIAIGLIAILFAASASKSE